VADLSFLAANDYAGQRRLMQDLVIRRLAGRVDAFASWNTVANTVGTALPEAIAVRAGRLMGTYDARANATFTFMRYVDDVAFHADVRPRLNADLSAQGIDDHTLLLPDTAQRVASENRALLVARRARPARADRAAVPRRGLHDHLPWTHLRTELDVRLAPRH